MGFPFNSVNSDCKMPWKCRSKTASEIFLQVLFLPYMLYMKVGDVGAGIQ